LLLDHADDPDDPFTLFNLGWNYASRGQAAEALPYLERSLNHSDQRDSIVRKLYVLILGCRRRLGQPAEALAVCREGLRVCPEDTELLFAEAELLHAEHDLRGAEKCLLHLLETQDGASFASISEGLRGFRARHLLASIYSEEDRLAEAEAQWRACLADQPRFLQARLGLGELYLRQQRLTELQDDLHQWEEVDSAARESLDGAFLHARLYLAKNDFPAARDVLEPAVGRYPEQPFLWDALSFALLQEGKDLRQAERVLHTVLELEPANANARRNLAVFLRNQGRYEEEAALRAEAESPA
jgi:tetratricopeptide (TPR) repeat protein